MPSIKEQLINTIRHLGAPVNENDDRMPSLISQINTAIDNGGGGEPAETHDVEFDVYPVKIICEKANSTSDDCNIRFEGCSFKYSEDTDEYEQKVLTLYARNDDNPQYPREGYLYFRDIDTLVNSRLIVIVQSVRATGKFHLSFLFSTDNGATWNAIPSAAQLRSYISERDGTLAYLMFVSNKPSSPSSFPFTKGNIIKVIASFEENSN